jgi:NTP pyrophosphatase (non-canonical NTP hydrolase)
MQVQLNEYQEQAMRTGAKHTNLRDKVTVCALGLAGESGEVADHLKKILFHGHAFNTTELIKELGDVLWYVAVLADALGATLDEVADVNIAKLRARYPEGFSAERSINRDPKDLNTHLNAGEEFAKRYFEGGK